MWKARRADGRVPSVPPGTVPGMTDTWTLSAEMRSPGCVDHFCDEAAPEIVQELSDSLGSLVLDHPGVVGLRVTVEVVRR